MWEQGAGSPTLDKSRRQSQTSLRWKGEQDRELWVGGLHGETLKTRHRNPGGRREDVT